MKTFKTYLKPPSYTSPSFVTFLLQRFPTIRKNTTVEDHFYHPRALQINSTSDRTDVQDDSLWDIHPPKTNMYNGQKTFEQASPIKNGDSQLPCYFLGVHIKLTGLQLKQTHH